MLSRVVAFRATKEYIEGFIKKAFPNKSRIADYIIIESKEYLTKNVTK
ncbi:MAG: hypothetical protein JJE21_03095 [Spirochaetaceae bacterium]|nr:hypothetical protein [Spirochaetaceae bacterium]